MPSTDSNIPALDRYAMALDCPGLADWAELASLLAAELSGRRRRVPAPLNAISFIVSRGGLIDDQGELRAMYAHRARPGLVNNRGGASADHMRELLIEAGYLLPDQPDQPPHTTVNDVWELVREGLAGRHAYSMHDQPPF